MTIDTEHSIIAGDKPVLLRWLEQSTHPADDPAKSSGWLTHMVEARSDGVVVGYLRISYATEESSYANSPDGLHFMVENRGWCLSFDDEKDLWMRAHLNAGLTPQSLKTSDTPIAAWRLTRSDAPSHDVLESDLAELHALGERERHAWLKLCATPTVTFPRVDDGERSGTNWRRRGIAKQMYCFAARILAERGMVLMASSLQSEDAIGLWASLECDPLIPTKRVRPPGPRHSRETRLVIDYRDQELIL